MKITIAHRCWAAAIALAALSACSNGRGSLSEPPSAPVTQQPPPTQPPPTPPPPDPPPTPPPAPTGSAMAGYWKGTATELDSGRTFDTVALVDAQGEAQWLLLRSNRDDDGFVVSGNVCCDSKFSDAMIGKELAETRTRDASIDTALAGGTLSGTLDFHDNQYRFALTASADYNRALTLQSLAGVYTRSTRSLLGEQVTLTLTIDANGQLNGSYSNGCVFNGNASIPDTAHNMVRLQVDLANCGSHGSSKQWNGAYSGLGVLLLDSDAAGTDLFYHSVIGPTWLGPQTVSR